MRYDDDGDQGETFFLKKNCCCGCGLDYRFCKVNLFFFFFFL